ncbi:MAG: TonB-dependent receptor [Acidobacteriota bacterium]|nr:TonB-dependent receptor [Acidobacteriota bacterium]
MTCRALIVSLLFVLLYAPLSLDAQTPAAAPAESARTYVPADFARFVPRTALDMLSRVPGFTIKQEDQERGLGVATGNVVINGQRISGKSNDVVTELGRIPASNVERIEIVDGATLNIPGLSGQVANVITRSRGISGQFSYRPEFRSYYTDPLFTRFDVSIGGTKGRVEYTFGLDNNGNRSGAGGPTEIFSANRTLIENRDEDWHANTDRPRISSRFVYRGLHGEIGNLNLSYRRTYFDYLEEGRRNGLNGDRRRTVTIDENSSNYEAGADYEFGLGKGRLKLIGVGRGTDSPSETTVITRMADGSSTVGDRFRQNGTEAERIGRAEYRWKDRAAEWQFSAEAAFNSLDNASRLFARNDAGTFEEVPLPGGTASVQEDRYEITGSYGRPVTSTLTMKLLAGGEYSQLEQVGAGGTTRTFYRPKGELSAAWKMSPHTDVNFKLARRVGQLNFYDFLASVNLRDDVETGANPDLVPEQSWDLDIEGVRNLGTLGSTTLRLYGRMIDDVIDYIPVSATAESPGNLDRATVYGIESRSTLNLDRFGWRGARVDASVQFQDSQVEDPLTGEQRQISSSLLRAGSIDVRHDITNSNWAWGAGASYEYYALSYRLSEVGRQWEGPIWGNLYVENKNVYGLTVRAGLYNLFAADSFWDRTVYTGRRTGTVEFIEDRHRQIGPIFSFAVRGKF